MAPRRYRMGKRQLSAGDTRQRILEATLSLHTEKGIFGTSWQDIAGRADVSAGTVYKNFPNLDALVPACGALLMERTRPPAPDDADRIVGDAVGVHARLLRIAEELFAFYERAGASLKTDARERELPAVREWEAYLGATIATMVRVALEPDRQDAAAIRLVEALLDPSTFDAMRMRGIKPKPAARAVGAMAACWLEHGDKAGPLRGAAPTTASKRSREKTRLR